jgi:anti-sigma factor RsiW
MSPEQARDLFSEAFEGDLDAERKAAFEAALADDEELKKEYDDFVDTFRMVGQLGQADDHAPPDLLRGVQERLRQRSRGRYYRDRFSQRAGPGWLMPLILAIVCLLLLAASYYVLHAQIVLEDAPSAEPERSTPR